MATSPVRALQAEINKALGVKSRDKRNMLRIADDACLFVGYDELPFCVSTAAEGIAWAIETGRLPSAIAAAVRNMTGTEATALLATVATTCNNMGEVPRWLIANADVLLPAAA